MKGIQIKTKAVAVLLAVSAACGVARADSLIKDGDVVGIIGDSITEQKIYSAYIEDYLLMCQPKKVRVINFGWSGEQVVGLNARIADVLPFKPTFVTTCYGMNDGHYTIVSDDIRRTYREASQQMIKSLVGQGARAVVGSPGAVDTTSFKRPNISPDDYNVNLACLGAEAKFVAEEAKQTYADVHTPMIDVMKQLKDKYGPNFIVAGNDGVHPGPDGHLIMAYAFLKAMGFDGNIGEYDVDLTAHTATATDGHKVVKVDDNAVTIESTQYPFCFFGKYGDMTGNLATTEFLPFNQDLNRLTLKVTGPAPKYTVKWGASSKTYTADELKAGVNLAADFSDNPFTAAFISVTGAVQQKQAAETTLIKQLVHALNGAAPLLKDSKGDIDHMIEVVKQRVEASGNDIHAWVKPITHTITIEAVN